MKKWRAAVIGGSGYGGAELIRRLLLHPDVELVRVSSVDHVGEPLGAVHLPLTGRTSLRFENLTPSEAAAGCDVALLALPHKVSAVQAPALLDMGVRVVDMSGDFRLRSAASYQRFYGSPHPHPELLPSFVYGLPELNRSLIAHARAVASPGCFATTVELGLLPLARAGWLRGPVHVVGITGSSGSGVVPTAATHHPVRAVNLKSYKPLEHQHTPEIEETLHAAGASAFDLRFLPVSAPLSRGILVTTFVEIAATIDPQTIVDLYRRHYAAEPFVRFVEERLPEVAAVAGSNFAEVGIAGIAGIAAIAGIAGIAGNPVIPHAETPGPTRTLVIQSVTDNLIKGGAGQAIQSMNLMLGLPETASLEDPGSWP